MLELVRILLQLLYGVYFSSLCGDDSWTMHLSSNSLRASWNFSIVLTATADWLQLIFHLIFSRTGSQVCWLLNQRLGDICAICCCQIPQIDLSAISHACFSVSSAVWEHRNFYRARPGKVEWFYNEIFPTWIKP